MADKKDDVPSLDSRISAPPASTSWADDTPDSPSTQDAPAVTDAPTKEKEEEAQPEDNLVNNTYDVTVKLADMQGDPNSPLFSVKTFEELGL